MHVGVDSFVSAVTDPTTERLIGPEGRTRVVRPRQGPLQPAFGPRGVAFGSQGEVMVADTARWIYENGAFWVWEEEGAVQGFLAFMAFNATVVFGAGAVRWAGLAACLGLLGLGAMAWYRRG